ncbi:F-box/LRR-repeat protein At3g59190 [Lactuca sativa]|uniref:F-box/LRR-repeat protein At3g59190 n=1 Tax=Lactuca sativa TaxID=4236 RepID=UPI000CB18EE3|nr:F-box/LRR-repeat protein At3g59190 [Lactuca sativa]
MTLHKFIRCKLKSVFLKTGKGHEQHESGDTVDDISNLPDCILHQILSFIPTKEVVKMSILSTRWKNLWASAPNIDFNDGLLYAKTVDGRCRPEVSSFINFVDRVLALRDPSNMEKFHLSCFVCNNASKIHSWISYAIMHNVQELDLCLFGVDPFVIPRCMLDSTPLVSLKIKMDCVIELPSHVSFPFLKTLHLSLVRFPDDASTEKLFSGCPFLEELVLLDCYLVNLNNIVISSSTLKSLTIHDLPYFGEFDDTSGCNIKIDAVNLTYFKYFGNLLNDILLNNALSLIDACIHIPIPQERETEVTYRAIDLLKQLRYVVSLRISNRIMESLIFADNMVHYSPVFSNLRHLVLTMESGKYPFGGLMDLLYFCPILQSICLLEGFGHHMCLGENDPILIVVPICMLSCLKIVTFKNFHANDSEIYFLKCILKYACVLERMDIVWSKTRLPDLKKQAQARTELETIQRSSTACHVKFS